LSSSLSQYPDGITGPNSILNFLNRLPARTKAEVFCQKKILVLPEWFLNDDIKENGIGKNQFPT
jgi:hypothetical protein